MTKIPATISLAPKERGGRAKPIIAPHFACPIHFDDVPSLPGAWDCRIFMQPGQVVSAGDTDILVEVAFLSPDVVLPHMIPGVAFRVWEAGFFGHGVIMGSIADGRQPRTVGDEG